MFLLFTNHDMISFANAMVLCTPMAPPPTGDTAVRRGVIEKLQAMYGEMYTDENVARV